MLSKLFYTIMYLSLSFLIVSLNIKSGTKWLYTLQYKDTLSFTDWFWQFFFFELLALWSFDLDSTRKFHGERLVHALKPCQTWSYHSSFFFLLIYFWHYKLKLVFFYLGEGVKNIIIFLKWFSYWTSKDPQKSWCCFIITWRKHWVRIGLWFRNK